MLYKIKVVKTYEFVTMATVIADNDDDAYEQAEEMFDLDTATYDVVDSELEIVSVIDDEGTEVG